MSGVNTSAPSTIRPRSLLPRTKILAATALAFLLCVPASTVVRAGEHGEAPPASVRFHVAVQGNVARSSLALEANGLVNWTGDVKATVTLTEPEQHSLSIVRVDATDYVSADDGPYKSFSEDAIAASPPSLTPGAIAIPPALPEACEQANAQTMSMPSQLLESLPRRRGLSLQDLGEETIDGIATEHIHAGVDLQLLLGATTLDPILQLATACGAPGAAFDSSTIEQVTAGSSVQLDANLDAGSRFPRHFDLRVLIPGASVDLSITGDFSPSDTLVPILAPDS